MCKLTVLAKDGALHAQHGVSVPRRVGDPTDSEEAHFLW
jgi:hypothetical protein